MKGDGGDKMGAGKKFNAGRPTVHCKNPDPNGNRQQRRAAKKIEMKGTKK